MWNGWTRNLGQQELANHNGCAHLAATPYRKEKDTGLHSKASETAPTVRSRACKAHELREFSLLQQHILSAVCEGDHQIHQDEHQVIVPAVGFLSPESGVPGEDFLLDRSQHEEDQSESGELCEDAKGDTQGARNLGGPEENREAFRHLDALRARLGVLQMAVAAGDENEAHHKSKQEQAEVGEAGELRKHREDLLLSKIQSDTRIWLGAAYEPETSRLT